MNWEENVCDGSGGVVAGRDGSMSVCELPNFWSGRAYQTQEWNKTCADLTPEEWCAEDSINDSNGGGVAGDSAPFDLNEQVFMGTGGCIVDPARPDAPTKFIPVMVWGGNQDGYPWQMEKYTHYLGPDSDPDTAGPQGVCVDFTTWGDGIYGEDWVPESYKSGRIVFTVPGNWSHTGCIAMTTPPPTPSEGCESDGARAAATVGGLAFAVPALAALAL